MVFQADLDGRFRLSRNHCASTYSSAEQEASRIGRMLMGVCDDQPSAF